MGKVKFVFSDVNDEYPNDAVGYNYRCLYLSKKNLKGTIFLV